jgi:hypothetical protein
MIASLKAVHLFVASVLNRSMFRSTQLFIIVGELELPLSTMLLVSVAPYQFMDLRYGRF